MIFCVSLTISMCVCGCGHQISIIRIRIIWKGHLFINNRDQYSIRLDLVLLCIYYLIIQSLTNLISVYALLIG